jgi:hypothetical protein
MSWIKVKKYFGLTQPYDFKVAIFAILNVAFLGIVTVLLLADFMKGSFHLGSARFFFYVYLASVLTLSLAFIRITLVSAFFLMWAALELSFALGSSALDELGLGVSFFPKVVSIHSAESSRFAYHPLLMGTPQPNFQSLDGRKVHHNSYGLRGLEPSSADLSKPLIFVYGGSTAYDVGVDQGRTWPERLQDALFNRFSIQNFGVPGYSSAENLIQTAFYQNIFEKRPVCAIYYLGWNDIRNAHIQNLDPGYADYHLLAQVGNLNVRKPDPGGMWRISPIANLIVNTLKPRLDSLPYPPAPVGTVQPGSDRRLEEIFASNVRNIAAINASNGVKSIFIGQILNRSALASEGIYGWLPFVRDKDVWPLQAHFNQLLENLSTENHSLYIDPGIDNFTNDDFVDNGHFSDIGSGKFARIISAEVNSYCQ